MSFPQTRKDAVRVAYLLMVHRNPDQVAALLRALPADSPVFVHIDARVPRRGFAALSALQEVRPFTLVRRHRCYWGRIGMVRATLELVRAALASGEEWQYASLLSGADYPIASNEAIADFLEEHAGQEFLSFWDMRAESNPWRHAPGRMQSDARVDRQHFGAGRRIVRSPWRRSMPGGLHPYGGSQWWTLSRQALEFVVRFTDEHPRYLRFMRGVFVPDECFVQTALGNSRFKASIPGDDLRYVDWDRPEPPHPAILRSEDVEVLGASGKLYARKFDLGADPGVFAAVDARLRGATPVG